MVEGKRADLRRMGYEQNNQYKRSVGFRHLFDCCISHDYSYFFKSNLYEKTD